MPPLREDELQTPTETWLKKVASSLYFWSELPEEATTSFRKPIDRKTSADFTCSYSELKLAVGVATQILKGICLIHDIHSGSVLLPANYRLNIPYE